MNQEYTANLLEHVEKSAAEANSEPQTILHKVYGSLIQGDYGAFYEALHPEVVFTLSGWAPMDGTWHGRDAVLNAAKRNYAMVTDQKPVVESIVANGESVAVLLRETGNLRGADETYSVRLVQWFTFAEGKITKIDQVVASVPERTSNQ